MRVLIGCESSGVVRNAFRALGHDAWSCDLLPADDGSMYHLQGDVLNYLDGRTVRFHDKTWKRPWDLLIAHPPCTYLCNSGVGWLWQQRLANGLDGSPIWVKIRKRWAALEQASKFFYQLWNAPIKHIGIENPIPHRYGQLPPYTQIVQPWMFGHAESKATCLFLKNLEPLHPTEIVYDIWKSLPKREAQRLHYLPPSPTRWKERSRTFEGLAKAMAKQFSDYIQNL